MRELLTVEQYLDELLALVRLDQEMVEVSLADAVGRVLARTATSPVSIPVFDNSAMDGYAVRFADVRVVPARLAVVGDVPAGSAADPAAGPGECVRIMTGAPLPGFADTVVPVEDTQAVGESILVGRVPARVGAHVRRAGEDIAAGAHLADPGTQVTPGLAGALAAAGMTRVPVRRPPVVAVCATGDELVRDGSALKRGQIYESNSVTVSGSLQRHGARVGRADLVGDSPEALIAWLDAAATDSDLVVLTGGASVGAYDVVRDVLSEHAHGVFRHVRVQPGKPQGWAVWPGGTPVVSLPGNPVSALLSCEVFVAPLLDTMLGRPPRPWLTAVAQSGWSSPAGRRQLVPVRLSTSTDGVLFAAPAHALGSGSHLVSALAVADGYAMVPEDATEVVPGERVPVRFL